MPKDCPLDLLTASVRQISDPVARAATAERCLQEARELMAELRTIRNTAIAAAAVHHSVPSLARRTGLGRSTIADVLRHYPEVGRVVPLRRSSAPQSGLEGTKTTRVQ